MQLIPTIHGAWNRDREHAARRDFIDPQLLQLGAHPVVAQPQRRTARRVKTEEFLFLRAPDNREQVAANPVAGRLHQSEGRIGRDGRIDGISPGLEHIETDLCSEGLAGGNHAILSYDLGTGGEGATGDAINLSVKLHDEGEQPEENYQGAGET